MKPKEILIKGKKVSYFDEGSGFPIVILHGGFVCKEVYTLVLESLKKNYRVIIPDLPGHGDSEELDEKNNVSNYVSFINSLVKKLRLKKFHIIGTSLGGSIGILYALQNKKDVDKLILQAPVFYWEQLEILKKPLLKQLAGLLNFRFVQGKYHGYFRRYVIEKRIPKIKSYTPPENWKRVESLIKINLEKFDKKLSKRASAEFALSAIDMDLRDQMKKIENRTLIIWGNEDATLNKKWGLLLKEIIPNSKYVEIRGTHDIVVERYEKVCEEIEKFLKEKIR